MIRSTVDVAERASLLEAAKATVAAAKNAGRDLTPEELADVNAKAAAITAIDDRAKAANAQKSAGDLILGLEAFKDDGNGSDKNPTGAKNLGEHFAKHALADAVA